MALDKTSGRFFLLILMGISVAIGVTVGVMFSGSTLEALIIAAVISFVSYLAIIYILFSAVYFVLSIVSKETDE